MTEPQLNFHGSVGQVNTGKVIVKGNNIGIQNNYLLTPEEQQAALDELKQVIQDLQTKYPTAEPAQQSAIIEVEFEEIKQKQEWRWKNLLKAKRLLNGGKVALTKGGEHVFEENLWGKMAIGFLEGVTEEAE